MNYHYVIPNQARKVESLRKAVELLEGEGFRDDVKIVFRLYEQEKAYLKILRAKNDSIETRCGLCGELRTPEHDLKFRKFRSEEV